MYNENIKKNYIFQIFNQIVAFVVPLILTPYISRIFLADGIGINSYTTATVSYFTIFSMLGISGYGQQSISTIRDDKKAVTKMFWELQIIHFFTFLCTGIIFCFIAFNSKEYGSYYFIHFITLIACFFDISWLYQAYEKFQTIAIRNSVTKVLLMLMTFAIVHNKSDLKYYIMLTATSTLLSNMFLWIGVNKYIDKPPFKELQFSKHFKDVFIYFIPTIAGSVYQILDKSVINWVTHSNSENGYYEQAYRIVSIFFGIVQSMATVSAPRMAREFYNGELDKVKYRLNRSLKFMLFLSVPISLGMAAVAPTFVPLFLGDGFDKTTYILYVFTPLTIVVGLSFYIDTMYLVPTGQRIRSAIYTTIGSIANLILNFFFVLQYASIGAAIATLLTEILITVLMIRRAYTVLDLKEVTVSFFKYLIPSLVMFVIVRIVASISLQSNFVSLIMQILSGIFIYFIAMVIEKDAFMVEIKQMILSKILKK